MTTGPDGAIPPAGVDPTSTSLQIRDLSPNDIGQARSRAGFYTLTLGAIGVVYGDIGTSPLYALREALTAAGASTEKVTEAQAVGLLSLILWALTIVVTLKYVLVLLRADNAGEGGTLSLMALAQRAIGRSTPLVFVLGTAGAALFFGDALITPAISVLSAVEGLKLATPRFEPYIVPISIGIIVGLFAIQSRGTASVAAWFGPITLVWFFAMAVGGLLHILDQPAIFRAVDPRLAVAFLVDNKLIGLIALGAVFLAVTGAEALYADLGHFGRRPIQFAWLFVAFPALALNYMGQAALVLANPKALENPFFLLYPDWALLPMVALATAATVIASQAVITGAYSLTRQAIQLRLLPRLLIRHTSAEQEGQIYMPQVNTLLLVGVLLLVVLFTSSSRLATAYGIAVTGTMVVTACLALIVIHRHWRWSLLSACALVLPFLAIDLVFLGANMLKLVEGGYVPLIVAAGVMVVMWTWVRGSALVAEKARRTTVPLADLLKSVEKSNPNRVPGTAIFLTSDPEMVPSALLHSLKHFKVIHENNIILTVRTADVPRVEDETRIVIGALPAGFTQVTLAFGYMEDPNVPEALGRCRAKGLRFDIMSTSFIVSRRSIRMARAGGMPAWQDGLFIALARNASNAADYFRLPTGRVVEIGEQILI